MPSTRVAVVYTDAGDEFSLWRDEDHHGWLLRVENYGPVAQFNNAITDAAVAQALTDAKVDKASVQMMALFMRAAYISASGITKSIRKNAVAELRDRILRIRGENP